MSIAEPNETAAKNTAMKASKHRLLIFGLGFSWLLISSSSLAFQIHGTKMELSRWGYIANELAVELPPASRLVEGLSKLGIYATFGSLLLVALSAFVYCVAKSRLRAAAASLCVATAFVAGASWAFYAARYAPNAWLAEAMEVPQPLEADQVATRISELTNPEQPRAIRLRAARAVLAIGYKHAAGILQVGDADRRRLIEIASQSSFDPETRYLAARSLAAIDHSSPAACQAISSAVRAALRDGNDQLKVESRRFANHRCLEQCPLEQCPLEQYPLEQN